MTEPFAERRARSSRAELMRDLAPYLVGSVIVLFLLLVVLNLLDKGNKIAELEREVLVSRFIAYENRVGVADTRAYAARTFRHACAANQASNLPRDDCDRAQAEEQQALIDATAARNKAAEVKYLLELEGVRIP